MVISNNEITTFVIPFIEAAMFIIIGILAYIIRKTSKAIESDKSELEEHQKKLEANELLMAKGYEELSKNQKKALEEKRAIEKERKILEDEKTQKQLLALDLTKREQAVVTKEEAIKNALEEIAKAQTNIKLLKSDLAKAQTELDNSKAEFEKKVEEFNQKIKSSQTATVISKSRR